MRFPHEIFIKFLISKGDDYKEVSRQCELYGLNTIPEKDFNTLLAQVKPPENFIGNSETHLESIQFRETHGINELWFVRQFPCVAKAFDILSKPLVRSVLDILAASPTPFEESARVIEGRFGLKVEAKTIECYVKIFANYGLMTHDELVGYAQQTKEYWRLAVMRGDVDMLKFHLGLDVHVQSKKIVNDTLHLAFFRSQETADMPHTPYTASSFGEYLRGIQWGIEERKALESGVDEIMDALVISHTEPSDPVYSEALPVATPVALQDAPQETANAKAPTQ